MLEALKEEYNTAIDNVIDMVNQGEFDVPATNENAAVKSNAKRISNEDAEFLRSLEQH